MPPRAPLAEEHQAHIDNLETPVKGPAPAKAPNKNTPAGSGIELTGALLEATRGVRGRGMLAGSALRVVCTPPLPRHECLPFWPGEPHAALSREVGTGTKGKHGKNGKTNTDYGVRLVLRDQAPNVFQSF